MQSSRTFTRQRGSREFKGCTTFRLSGKRYGILNETVEEEETATSETESTHPESGEKATACFFDPITGARECS